MSKHDSASDIPQPPQPPEFERKLKVYPYQLIALPLLLLVPILALFGVFGETTAQLRAEQNGIELDIRYSNRVLFQGIDGSEISIRNTGGEPIPSLTLTIEKAFLDNYSELSFTPDVSVITDEVYRFDFTDIQPDETRIVMYDSRGKLVGSHRGVVTASDGTNAVSLTLETLILP